MQSKQASHRHPSYRGVLNRVQTNGLRSEQTSLNSNTYTVLTDGCTAGAE